MKTSRISHVLATLGIIALFGCGPTMTDLKALNPRAATLQVRCHPGKVPEPVKLMALQSGTDHIVTDEQQDELMGVAPIARVFIEFKDDAPYENALIMASEYGLSCPNIAHDEPPASESLRDKEPCPAEVSQSEERSQGNWMAVPGKPDCNTPAPAKKVRRFVRVCARPPEIGANIDRWAARDSKGQLLTNNEKVFADAVAQADIIFIFDPKAAPESVYWFVNDPALLSCPNQSPPMPYAKAKAAGRLEMMAAADAMGATLAEGSATGDGKTTDTSSPTGKGPPLSTFEKIARNMNLLAAVANMDTSGNPKHPEGDRHGMVNGTNVGGWSFPALQIGLSAIQVITAVGVPSKEFVLKIFTATKGGQRVIINEADKAALKMADELVKEAGQYELAKGFQEISAVLPFNLGQKFTAGLESKFQAHKIFEKQAFKHFEEIFGKEGAKEGFEEAIEKAPSVILTDLEHKALTEKLNKFWRVAKKDGQKVTQKELREHYQDVYKDHPHWLQAIEHLLRQVP